MCRTEGVVFAFHPLGETAETVALAQRAHAVAAAGQNLVRIGLVADIPDSGGRPACRTRNAAHRQLDDTKARSQMTAGHRHHFDQFLTQLVGEIGRTERSSARKSFGVATRSRSGVVLVSVIL